MLCTLRAAHFRPRRDTADRAPGTRAHAVRPVRLARDNVCMFFPIYIHNMGDEVGAFWPLPKAARVSPWSREARCPEDAGGVAGPGPGARCRELQRRDRRPTTCRLLAACPPDYPERGPYLRQLPWSARLAQRRRSLGLLLARPRMRRTSFGARAPPRIITTVTLKQ